jgi:ATP-binding cassette subfamily F protein uup
MEINSRLPEGVFRCEGDYSIFLEHRDQLLASQQQAQRALQGKARRELEWLRKSPQARTSKSRSRVQSANSLQDELQVVKGRNRDRKAEISFAGTGRETRKLVSATNLSKSIEGRQLFSGADITLSPGTRLGIVGVNGTGKSTLLRMFSGEVQSDTGTIKVAEGVKILHFDQHREQLPLDITLRQALSEDGETVYYHGRPLHVSGWAERFLFSKERLDQQLGKFSGGERARLLIARLVLQPADVLLLDEPTNDLDIDTLEILEESLGEFPGAVVLITHDRLMLDEVSTEILGLGTDSDDQLFADYAQWTTHRQKVEAKDEAPQQLDVKPKKKLKFSYKEQQELAAMEGNIGKAEAEVERLEKESLSATGTAVQEIYQKMGEAQEKVDQLYARWEELEQKKGG